MSGLFGGGSKASTTATKAMGIDFQGAQYGPPVSVVYGQNKVPGNCVWYGDFKAQAQQQKSGKGGGGGGTTNYTYSASAQMGLCEGPGISLVKVYDGNSVVDLSSINYAFASGAKGQAAWSHLSGSAALGYSLTALFSFQNLALGSQASLPNYNYEVKGLKPFSASIVDANPSDIVSDVCSDPYHGVNFPWLGDLTQYSNYCVANGLFLSPVYNQQQTANQTLADLFKYTNTYVYYSDDQLKVVPLGDVAVTGNGVTFTPNVTPLVDLDDTDFLVGSGDPAVTFDRVAPQNALNLVRVEFTDRSNTYHDSGVVGAIDYDVVANGERSDTSETVNGCTTAAVARFIAQNLVQRAFYIRNTYQFKLPWNYCYLEPTDIVTLTNASLGLNKFPVRITSVEEDGGSVLTIEAEEFPEGIGHSSIYGTQANGGTNVDQNADPGPVNPPYLFRGPGMLVSNNTPEIWCACNGSGDLWGACEVYLSHDGSSYTYTGTIASQARYGELTSSLPVGSADPDTTNTPIVQLYAPAQLLGGSQTDADNFVTLAMVDTEIIGYETAALQSANTYKLTYLRRGGYGSTNAAHAIGAPFVRLDDSIFRLPVDPSLIGSTVYLKFLSLNVFGRGPRTLAEETAYTYVVGTNVELPDVPDVPHIFAVLPIADGVNITWTNDNPAAVGCTSVEFATAVGGPWTSLAQVGPTTTTYTHHFTDGSTYYYRARARGPLLQSGWSAYTATLNSQGVNVTGTGGMGDKIDQLGNLSNSQYLQNPFFSTGDLTGWTSDHHSVYFESGANGPASASTSYAVFPHGTASEALRNVGKIPVYPGAVIKAQCAVRGVGTPNGVCGVRISWRDASDAEIASSMTPNPSTGNATNGTYVTGTAPAGAMFAHVECATSGRTDTGGFYTVDNFAAWALADTLDQVPDSATRFGASEAGADKTSGKPLSSLTGRTLDNIGDSASRFAAAESGADKTAGKSLGVLVDGGGYVRSIQSSTSETVDNADFEASTTTPVPGWIAVQANLNYVTGVNAYAGTQSLSVTTTAQFGSAQTTRRYPCAAGDQFLLSAAITNIVNAGPTFVLLNWMDKTGAVISPDGPVSTTAGWGIYSKTVTAPASAVAFLISLQNNGVAGSAAWFDQIRLARIRSLDTEIADGPTYGRPANLDLYSSGGVNRVGLRVPGSGHTIGDQRNLQPITWASQRSVLSNSPISFSISGTTVNFSVVAVTLQGGGISLNYGASSGSVTQSAGTTSTWFLYYLDPTQSGGSLALHITTNPGGAASFASSIFLGTAVVTVASGGGGSGGTGGGGGGYCVADEMFIAPGRLAGDAEIGDPFDCIDLPTAAGKHMRALQGVTRGIEECVRMITSDGCALVCSVSTPFDLPDGRTATAPHMLGEPVITDLGTANVISLALVGSKPVTRAHLGGVSYAAGADPQRRIYSHNASISKP